MSVNAIVNMLRSCELKHKSGCLAPTCEECIRRIIRDEIFLQKHGGENYEDNK